MEPLEIKSSTSSQEHTVSKTQIIFLVVVLAVAGAFFLGRQFGWFGAPRNESIMVPSGQSHTEATVIGAYERVVLANRIVQKDKTVLPKKLEILTDEKTVFAKITSSGPVKISWQEIAEGDVIWVYSRVRTLEETVAEPVDPTLAIPFEDMMKNPRERIKADFVVKVGGK